MRDWPCGQHVEPAGAEGQPAPLAEIGSRAAVLDIKAACDIGADAAREEGAFVEDDAVILAEARIDGVDRRRRADVGDRRFVWRQ